MTEFSKQTEEKFVSFTKQILNFANENIFPVEDEENLKLFLPSESDSQPISKSNYEEKYIINYFHHIYNNIANDKEEVEQITKYVLNNDIYDLNNISSIERGPIYDWEERKYTTDPEGIVVYDMLRMVGLYAIKNNSLDFSEKKFRIFFDRYSKKLKAEPVEHHVFCPIVNIEGPLEEINLPDHFDFKNLRGRYEIIESNIVPMDDYILSGIYTKEGKIKKIPRLDPEYKGQWSHYLKLKILGNPGKSMSRQFIKSLGRCFRLKKPRSPIVYLGPSFATDYIQLYDDYDIPRITGSSPPEQSVEKVFTTKSYGLRPSGKCTVSSDEIEDISIFIDRYLDYVNAERDTELVDCLRRYDEMFSNIHIEDKLVDCTIGFEASLLRDLGNSSSFTFRMKIRGGVLLDDFDIERDYIHDFFKSLYYLRGEIVHNDRNINEMITDLDFELKQDPEDEKEFALEYSKVAKAMLSKTIISYLDMELDFDKGITETNLFIDKNALNVEVEFDDV